VLPMTDLGLAVFSLFLVVLGSLLMSDTVSLLGRFLNLSFGMLDMSLADLYLYLILHNLFSIENLQLL
jgi:hypothetical protein